MTRCAVDIGGTFTDVVAFDPATGLLEFGKTLSTPHDLIEGVLRGIDVTGVAPEEIAMMVHGSTVVVNALIERRGARTALVTTRGFRDVYEIGRINRPDAFNLRFAKHQPLVARELVFEMEERMGADGVAIVSPDLAGARELCGRLRAAAVESVAVMLLHSYRNPEHELLLGRVLAEELPGCFVTLSHQVSREYREFERTSTAAANAFVGPVVSDYLQRLEARLLEIGATGNLTVMQSNGGVCDVEKASVQCVQMLESGPAGGVVGTIEMCRHLGLSDAIAFDMGGTTAKSAVIQGLQFPVASDYFLGGYLTGLPIRIPCLDIVEVGTGGGSLAWLDDGGSIHVGPRSAGADPGPACYGAGGTEPTITDATVVLGHLPPNGRLVGGVPLDADAALRAIHTVAEEIGLDAIETAAGIVDIAAVQMANSVRAVTTERGLDPRDFVLFAYGGNGPLHISAIARELGIDRVIVPRHPALFSAIGMLHADARADVVQTGVRAVDDSLAEALEASFRELETECELTLKASTIDIDHVRFLRAADMRYVGQEHTVTVTLPEGERSGAVVPAAAVKAAFDQAHGIRYAHNAPDEPAQIVSLRVTAVGRLPKPPFERIEQRHDDEVHPAPAATRPIVFDVCDGPITATIHARDVLRAGHRIHGPAVVEESTATTLLRPGDEAVVDDVGNLVITIGGR